MQTIVVRGRDWRLWLLCTVAIAVCAATALHGPVAQDQAYHRFADARALLGVPNFWNVVSNLPFLLIGLWGVLALARGRAAASPRRLAYRVFFAASALVAFGSAYYHARPDDAHLVWDRLPMTLAFMAFFAAIVDRHLRPGFAVVALLPLLLIGLSSVLWWRYSGDLRVYLLVQFLPILLIPLILLLFPVTLPGIGYLWAVLGVYVLAKVLEVYDAQTYAVLGMSGHSLKHMAAAAGVFFVLRAVWAENGGDGLAPMGSR